MGTSKAAKRQTEEKIDTYILLKSMTVFDKNYSANQNPLDNRDLQLLAESCNVPVNSILQNIKMNKKNEILAQHHAKIWYSEPTNRWWTRLPNKKKISATKKEDLENRIIAYYIDEQQKNEVVTLSSIWEAFQKSRDSLNKHTLGKQIFYWNTYYANSELVQIPLNSITRADIRAFFTNLLKKFPMTYSYFKNVKSLLNLMLNYGLDKEILDINKMAGMEFNKKPFKSLYKPTAQHEEDEDALCEDEIQQLIAAAESYFEESRKPCALGIPIALLTGMRIGELSGLKYSDFNAQKSTLTLSRMNVADCKDDDFTKYNGHKIVNGLKADHPSRTLYVDQMVFYYLDLIRKKSAELGYPTGDDDFIFWRNNHNTNHETIICSPRTFDSLMRTYCRRCGFSYSYSVHDLRRTYVTTLADSGVPLSDIKQQVGHTTVEMTMRYLRPRLDEEEKKTVLNGAFNHLKKNN